MSDLDHLARVLADAEDERTADIESLAFLTAEEKSYLGALGEIPDPETDGLECDR